MNLTEQRYFKATNDMGCCANDMCFSEVGKVYYLTSPDRMRLCRWGIHFCRTVTEVFEFYKQVAGTRVFEVRPLGRVIERRRHRIPGTLRFFPGKCVTDQLEVVRELSKKEIIDQLLSECSDHRFSETFIWTAAWTCDTLSREYAQVKQIKRRVTNEGKKQRQGRKATR